jgi:integrase
LNHTTVGRGIFKRGEHFWIEYWNDGERFRESVRKATGKNSETAAETLFKQRLGEMASGSFIGTDEKKVRLSELRELIDSDYRKEGYRSADRIGRAWAHVAGFFGAECRAVSITTDRLYKYEEHRRDEGAAAATVRNELAALRRAFAVAVERKRFKLGAVPVFPTITVKNARDVFLTDAEVEAVRAELPSELRNLWTVAAWTGWRRNELFNLKWSEVDLVAGVARLNVGTTKNGEGREVPFSDVPALATAFSEQRAYTSEVERRTGSIVQHVFHRNGRPIKRMDEARKSACRRAGVIGPDGRPKILHDLRRTAARALTRAGAPRNVTMAILGHKTESMWRRYSIVETDDLRAGLSKVVAFRVTATKPPQSGVSAA